MHALMPAAEACCADLRLAHTMVCRCNSPACQSVDTLQEGGVIDEDVVDLPARTAATAEAAVPCCCGNGPSACRCGRSARTRSCRPWARSPSSPCPKPPCTGRSLNMARGAARMSAVVSSAHDSTWPVQKMNEPIGSLQDSMPRSEER